jgi:ectoine hydroxylase-related dioxygenase (phytanoyl-CoA dioxygenase family)
MITNKFQYATRTLNDFKEAMETFGWVIYENALDADFVERIGKDLGTGYQLRRKIQQENGIADHMDGTSHHLLERDNFSLPFLDNGYCHDEITHYLGGKYILNGLNGVIHAKQEHPYLSNMHRDIRSYQPDTKTLLQMIVTLDDFHAVNGATYFLSGSHKKEHRPDEAYFYEHAARALTPKGSIILFDSNIWHAAGENFIAYPRRALTIGYTRPSIKQQFDYCRFLGYSFVEKLSPQLRQVIGYNARIPENLYEYYQPVHLRMYQRDQG